MCDACSGFFNELGFQLHRAKSFNLAIDVVIAFDQTDIFDLGADLDHRRSITDFQVFDQRDGIAILKQVSVRVFPDFAGLVLGCTRRPRVSAFRAVQQPGIFTREDGLAAGAGWQSTHGIIRAKV